MNLVLRHCLNSTPVNGQAPGRSNRDDLLAISPSLEGLEFEAAVSEAVEYWALDKIHRS